VCTAGEAPVPHDGTSARAKRGTGDCDADGFYSRRGLRASHVARGPRPVARPNVRGPSSAIRNSHARRRGRCGVAGRGRGTGRRGARRAAVGACAPACVRARLCRGSAARHRACAALGPGCTRASHAGPSRRRWRWRAGSCCRAVTSVCCAGVGITFEPDLQYGSPTNGMHIITKIRPNSPADKSKLPPEPAGLMISASRTRARAPPRLRAHAHARTGSPSLLLRAHGLDGAGRSWSARRVYKLRRLGYRGWE